MLESAIKESAILERISQLEQRVGFLEQENQKKDQRIEAIEQENTLLKQKNQQVEQLNTLNAELISKLLYRVYQLELSQACFFKNNHVVAPSSILYQSFSIEELEHHEEKIKMQKTPLQVSLKQKMKGKCHQVQQFVKEQFLKPERPINVKLKDILKKTGFDRKTIRKGINQFVGKFPDIFSIEKYDKKSKMIFLRDPLKFESMMYSYT